MATPTMAPAGWHADPTARHEYRYWDGAAWTPMVSDHGITATDALVVPPQTIPAAASPGPPPPATRAGAAAVPDTARTTEYRAVAVPVWRVVALRCAATVAALALTFEVIASVYLNSEVNRSTLLRPPSRSTFERWAWLYHYTAGNITYGYPPLLLWLALFLALILPVAVLVRPAEAIKKASARRIMWNWSALQERSRLRRQLRDMGAATTLFRGRVQRVLLTLAGLAALAVTTISGYALLAKEGLSQESGTFTGALSAGLGPKVCLLAGIVGIVGGLVAWPWKAQRQVTIGADGSVHDAPRATANG
jgi:hypothetical protein